MLAQKQPLIQRVRNLSLIHISEHVDMDHPVLLDKYIMGTECEVDAICDGENYLIPGIMEPVSYTHLDVVLVCGPTVMMRNAARLCAEKGTPCFVSLEKKMACGIGACLGCTCRCV